MSPVLGDGTWEEHPMMASRNSPGFVTSLIPSLLIYSLYIVLEQIGEVSKNVCKVNVGDKEIRYYPCSEMFPK